MKKIYQYIVIFTLGITSVFGGGTSQEHLVSVNPHPNVEDASPTMTAVFSYDKNIVKKSVHKNTVKLKQTNPQKNNIKGTVAVQSDMSLAFMPSQPLEKGTYKIKVKSINLQHEGQVEFKPKNSWQKFIVWLCGLMYDDIADCPLCKYFCNVGNYIKTKPIVYTFEVKDDAPTVTALDVNVKFVELSEHNQISIRIIANYEDNTTEDVTQKASYASSDSSVDVDKGIITSNVEGSSTVTISYGGKATTVQVEVYEMIEGHLLPHEPENPDATLLGVDENNNSVRDEVERWIYKEMPTYHHPEIERVIAMQKAKAYQMALVDPTNKDDIVHKAMERGGDCWAYYSWSKNLPFDGVIQKFSNSLKDKQFNTKERLKTYMQYNYSLKGRVFKLIPLRLLNTSYCDKNIDILP